MHLYETIGYYFQFFPPFHILEFVVEVCAIREVVNFALDTNGVL